jgi:hypothetical protein
MFPRDCTRSNNSNSHKTRRLACTDSTPIHPTKALLSLGASLASPKNLSPFADNYPPLAHNHSMVTLAREAGQNRISLNSGVPS